ncbi:MAG TPA: N-acetyl-gamma-glutamyl-phosphate reductase [Thermomicrobiales bacterium]|jgi:N-acetyl-gamma-glutamyl-phosphate/LysW-gamma-L-alpha-aminoadipyl-6-phosphate reductase|nr:N-acetyl-gamma-glutamyl-phosphate reductase [Thermomicrobiales bacterium]
MDVSIIGGSGYAGGELVRLLLGHREVNLKQVTSERYAGKFVRLVHPNLRKRTDMKFVASADLEPCDVLFLALPHGVAMKKMPELEGKAKVIIDLSADYRLRNPADYDTWYGHPHEKPEDIARFTVGIPELHRDEIAQADRIACAGCMATTSILGLYPLYRAGVVDTSIPVFIEAKTGSSGSGGEPNLGSHHPERSGAMRSFKPTGHRHSAEIIQELTFGEVAPPVSFSATSVEAVRGILTTSHVTLKDALTDKDIWQIYRPAYRDEPFMRLVKEASGVYRYPEPKLLSGSNYCDVGFERDPHSNRLVVMAATDNLMKGAAGQGVQCMNVRCGFPEDTALEFTGLHPI